MSPPSAPSVRNGFSLVELMVVVFVMGLMAAVAVLAWPDQGQSVRREADRLAARASAARDAAITGGSAVSLVVDARGYRFERRANGAWQKLSEAPFAPVRWPSGLTASGATEGGTRVAFDEVGLAGIELALTLQRGPNRAQVRIARDGAVSMQ